MKVTTTNTKTKKIVTIEKDVFSLYPKTMSLDVKPNLIDDPPPQKRWEETLKEGREREVEVS